MAEVTALLTTYKRWPNLRQLIESLESQTERPVVWVADNNPDEGGWREIEHFTIDRYVWCRESPGPNIRLLLAPIVETPWTLFMDDDMCPADDDWLADMLKLAKDNYPGMVGIKGRMIGTKPPYYRDDVMEGPAYILKGHAILLSTDCLRERVRQAPDRRDDDIRLSLDMGRGWPIHYVSRALRERTLSLPEGPHAISNEKGHWQRRHRAVREWLDANTDVLAARVARESGSLILKSARGK